MGQSDSKKKIEEEFQIYKLEDNGNALLRSKVDDKDYLMRVVSCTNQSDLDRLKTLLENRAQMKNHHLLSLVEIKEKQQDYICSIQYKMYLVLEYSFKNTAEEIKERTKNHQKLYFQESDIWSILYSCCTALQALYSNGISHESLTAEQIFINKDGFIKISEPLLFGLQKNHLEAMRTKDNGVVNVHLSPQIMNCLEDQNFFFYEKQKSDIFILAMIVIDLALLKTNYLYDVPRRRPQLELIPDLLKKVGERYSSGLTSILSEMLRIQSKSRPNLNQIVQRVEKCNNIGQDFTLQTQSNLKSNDVSSEKDQDRLVFQKPAKYKQLQIKEDSVLEQSTRPRVIQERVVVRQVEQPSFSINEQTTTINKNNIEGRILSTNHNLSFQTTQGAPSAYHQKAVSSIPAYSNHQTQPSQTVNFQSFRKSFDLYERSRSIDSIKMGSNELKKPDFKQPISEKKVSPFQTIEVKNMAQPAYQPPPETFKKPEILPKRNTQPLFTHQIPQVYNILVKNSKTAIKTDLFSNQEKKIILDKEHVSTPQFQGQIQKVNRFTSFKNYPNETVSRLSEDIDLAGLNHIQMKKNISHAQSETYRVEPQKKMDLDSFARGAQSPNIFPKNTSFGPPQHPTSQFSKNQPFSGSVTGNIPGVRPPLQFGSTVSQTFTPTKTEFGRRSESKTCRSGFQHQNNDQHDPDMEYVKEQIPDRGRYEGYKLYDQRNGHGILYFKDGGYYEGEWKSDKMNGFGKLYYQNGSIAYQGHWQNDEFNGQGRVYNMEPLTFVEEFNYKDFSQLGNKWTYYDGQFKSDSKHGKGYIRLTNGQMFQGIFDHDMIEGNGIFYKRSGEIIIGFWIDNKLFLNQSYENEKK